MAEMEFPEPDWKLLRKVNSSAYDRHCSASIQMIEALLAEKDLAPAEKFEKLSKLTRKRSKEQNSIFDTFNFSRSNALMILCSLYNWGLVTPEEIGQFTPAVRARVVGTVE